MFSKIEMYFFFFYFLNLTPEPWPDGELFEQSSELDEDVDVGVMETELFPETHERNIEIITKPLKKKPVNKHFNMAKRSPDEPFVLFKVFGFLFRVWIPSFFIASGRGTYKMETDA